MKGDIGDLFTLVCLGIIGTTFAGNLVWIAFDKGKRWKRFLRAIGFLVGSFCLVIAMANTAPDSGETPGQLAALVLMLTTWAFLATFGRSSWFNERGNNGTEY
jgi:peptidoglycan/LPS O-acetylase OafA/YrhL